jgi:type II secretory pathway pseudopilin PulG
MTMNRAFTLIEILASLLLFTLGVTAVIGVFLHGQKSAIKAQGDATAFATAMAVLRDPLPMGAETDPVTGRLIRWMWSQSGNVWSASDGSSLPVWTNTTWSIDQPTDILVPDMVQPIANNPAVFIPGGNSLPGCSRGWLNGYYIERREQSRRSDIISAGNRMVEVRVDVYWVNFGSDGRPLASVIDRIVRQGSP